MFGVKQKLKNKSRYITEATSEAYIVKKKIEVKDLVSYEDAERIRTVMAEEFDVKSSVVELVLIDPEELEALKQIKKDLELEIEALKEELEGDRLVAERAQEELDNQIEELTHDIAEMVVGSDDTDDIETDIATLEEGWEREKALKEVIVDYPLEPGSEPEILPYDDEADEAASDDGTHSDISMDMFEDAF